jgi:hypothetical protein
MKNNKNKERLNNQRQEFLHTFFEKGLDEKAEHSVEVNGFILLRHWNGNTKKTEVAIYNKEAFQRREDIFTGDSPMQRLFLEMVERDD